MIGRNRMSTRKLMKRFYRPWYRRPFAWMLVLLPVLFAGRLLLAPALQVATLRALPTVGGHPVTIDDVDVSIFPPMYAADGVAIGSGAGTVLTIDRLEARFSWRDLVRRNLVASLWLDGARWRAPDARLPIDDVRRAVAEVAPLTVTRVELDRGEVYLPGAPFPFLASVRGTADRSADGALKLSGQGKALGDGVLLLEATLSAGDASVMAGQWSGRGIPVGTLDAYGVKVAAPPPIGAFDLAARFEARDGRVGGTMVPVKSTVALANPAAAEVQSLRQVFGAFMPEVTLARVAGEAPGAPGGVLVEGRLPVGQGAVVPALAGLARALLVESVGLALEHPPVGESISTAELPAEEPALAE